MIISINFFPLIHYFSSKIADTMSKWEFLYFFINCDGDLSSYGLTEYNLIDLTFFSDRRSLKTVSFLEYQIHPELRDQTSVRPFLKCLSVSF